MRCVCVTAEFELLCGWKLEHILESLTNFHQIVTATCFSSCSSPETDSVKTLSDVDNHTHDFVVTFILQGFTNCSELCVKPQLVDVDQLLVLETV